MNILLPTDFYNNSWNAIRYALHLFKNEKCNLYLFHVIKLSDLITDGTGYNPLPDTLDDHYTRPAKRQLRKFIERGMEIFGSNNWHRYYTEVGYDFFIDAIKKKVVDKRIDLIIMGTKGISNERQRILGSNAADVITKVACTSLVIPQGATFRKLSDITFPTDFSPLHFNENLQLLLSIIRRYNSTLRILYINKQNIALSDDQSKQKNKIIEYFKEIDLSFHELTNRKVEDAIQCFVESRNTDLLVMAVKDHGFLHQIFYHSKIREISFHTEIPFLIIHERSLY